MPLMRKTDYHHDNQSSSLEQPDVNQSSSLEQPDAEERNGFSKYDNQSSSLEQPDVNQSSSLEQPEVTREIQGGCEDYHHDNQSSSLEQSDVNQSSSLEQPDAESKQMQKCRTNEAIIHFIKDEPEGDEGEQPYVLATEVLQNNQMAVS